METIRHLDLFNVYFWVFLGVAVVLLASSGSPRLRDALLAGLNFSFLSAFLGVGQQLQVLAYLTLAYLTLKAVAGGGRSGTWLAAAGSGVTLALFLIHKPGGLFAGNPYAATLRHALAVVGFSYVALRFVDAAAAVRGKIAPAPDFLSTVNYLIPFHMLAAGPIQSYEEFASRPRSPRPPTFSASVGAFDRIARGLFKKYVLASILKAFTTDYQSAGSAFFFVEVQLNMLWLFLDFSAYSDIAVGAGKLLGVPTPENFDRPLLSRNIIEFWSRWHMSLSSFIRRTIFTPIQLHLTRATRGRHPLATASAAFLVSFVLCGLWHGVNPRWFVWGVFQASGLITCNVYRTLLARKLGRDGMERYRGSKLIRAVSNVLTVEFFAFSMVIVMFPTHLRDLLQWTRTH